jgi:hypothetical protein
LNQIEIYFSVVQRKVLTPNDFPNLQAVEKRLLDFQAYYETIARPFEWKFTRADLDELLVRVAQQERNPYKVSRCLRLGRWPMQGSNSRRYSVNAGRISKIMSAFMPMSSCLGGAPVRCIGSQLGVS